jgi:hypothetical protein
MASLYKRPRSPFWWIEYVDAAGTRRQESTKQRYVIPAETRKARALRTELSGREIDRATTQGNVREVWAAWVPRFLEQRYAESPATYYRSGTAWRNIEAFLLAHGIAVPRQLTRQQVRDYIEWRQKAQAEAGTRKARKNTALLEVKFLAAIMHEAVESGFAPGNPCVKLGSRREKAKEKPKITDAEHKLIMKALKREPEWMRLSYIIAWEQGCRFSETCFALCDVNFAANTLGLRTKGHKESIAEVPLSPRLRPLLLRLKKREMTFEMPAQPSRCWWRFFHKNGLGHLCFHCTRVTFISRCYEQGIARETVMRLVLHASETVHQIYPRIPAAGRILQEAMKKVAA